MEQSDSKYLIYRTLFSSPLAWTLLFIAAGGVFLVFELAPLGALISFSQSSLDAVVSYLGDPVVRSWAKVTFYQAFATTVITGTIALFLGLKIKLRSRFFWNLLALPMVMPSIVFVVTWLFLLSQLTWARTELLYSWSAVILAHVFINYSWVALTVAQARERIPVEWIELAQVSGARPWSVFTTVVWPSVRGSFLYALYQVYQFSTMSFVLVLFLGGGPPRQTLEVALYSAIRNGLDLEQAIAISIWQGLLTLLPWVFVEGVSRSREGVQVLAKKTIQFQNTSIGTPFWVKAILILPALLPVALFIDCFIQIALDKTPLWGQWLQAQVGVAVLKSGIFAGFSSIIAVVVVWVALFLRAYFAELGLNKIKSWLGFILVLPSAFSVFMWAIGFYLAYRSWVDPFEGSLLFLILIQAVLLLPVVFKMLRGVFDFRHAELWQTALSCGASPWKSFWHSHRTDLVQVTVQALKVSFIFGMGEIAMISLFAPENWVTLPLLISRTVSQYQFLLAELLTFVVYGLAFLIFVIPFQIKERRF